ncbi:ABC transporter permease [Lacipirellula sp.]|uniref:ABC transporter permease n=1 Tax=Lacipirellula sp. TaxID=2691419 RepID=UPI003D0DC8B2
MRQHLHGKRWLVISALFSIPAALALLVRFTSPDVPPRGLEFLLGMMLLPQLLIPLVALLYASGMIEDEQEEQTITYLLVRPLPKWGIYLVKFLATVTTTVALTAAFTALAFAAIYVGSGVPFAEWSVRLAKIAGLHSLAVTAYCSLFGLLSLLTKRALIVGVVYIAVIEGLLANLPFGIRLITVIYHARMIAYRSLSFVVTTPHMEEDIAAEAWQLNLREDPQLLLHPAASTSFTSLAMGTIACVVLAAWLCSQREFHVKTPEKA